MSNIFVGEIKEINRVALSATKKRLFNTNRIGELKADSTDSVFPYTLNKVGDRYSATEYKINEAKTVIDPLWAAYEPQIVLPVLKKKVDAKEYAYAETISLNVADIAFGWADPDDATKCWIEVYPSAFKKVLYKVNQPLATLNGLANILTFAFLDGTNAALSADAVGTIDWDAATIAVTVPALTTVTALVATFTLSTGASAKLTNSSGTAQVSGVTANNFTSPVVYYIAGSNGVSKSFTITVTVAS